MKKKVFFVMNTDDASGAEKVNFTIIEYLKNKYDFIWVSKKGKINYYLKKLNIKWIEIEKMSIHEIKRVIKEYNPDIIHATDFKSSVICAATMTKIPVISHLHHNAEWIKKININTILYFLATFNIKKILTVSPAIENEYIFSKFISKKIECIDNPVTRKNILKELPSTNVLKKYDICCVGRLTEAKNPMRFVKILSKIKEKKPKVKAIWIGDGELRKEIENEIISTNLQENIELVGYKENPYELMEQSKIFMLTSRWEGFGLVVYEALTIGLPCLTSNVGGLPKIVDDDCGALCTKDKEFVDNAIQLLTNDNKLKTYSEKSKIKAIKLENIKEYIEKLDNIYSNI